MNGYRELMTADRQSSIDWPKPVYPLDARKAREEAAVVLRVFFSAEGKAERVLVETRVGSPRLAELAAQSAKSLQIPPQLLAGKAVRFFMDLPVQFMLSEGPSLSARLTKHLQRSSDRRLAAVEATRALAKEIAAEGGKK